MARTPVKKILIVEPQDDVRRMLDAMLHAAGYAVIALSDARAAWEFLRVSSKSIDLLLSAATTRPITGVELAEWVTHLRPEIKILIMTAGGQEISCKPGWMRLAKPFSRTTLLETVEESLT